MKTILIACGTGNVSSAIISEAVEKILRRNKVKANIQCCRYSQLGQYVGDANVIITSVSIPEGLDVPVIMGTPFLTGQITPTLERDLLKLLA